MSEERITLVASSPDGRSAFAHYRQTHGQPWKLYHWTASLEFLRFCSITDAPSALKRRGFSWRWTNRRVHLDRFETQGYSRYAGSGRYGHAKRAAARIRKGACS